LERVSKTFLKSELTQEIHDLNNQSRFDLGARALWAVKSRLNDLMVGMAASGQQPPELHPEPLPDWWPGLSRPDDENEDCGLGIFNDT
jgi:hypothetical protein